MSNHANQVPSYEADTIEQSNSSYLCLSMGHAPAEIKFNQGVVKKDNRGNEGSKQFTLNYTAATEALKSGFGTEKYFVQRNKSGNDMPSLKGPEILENKNNIYDIILRMSKV